jgi:hypothetical protein
MQPDEAAAPRVGKPKPDDLLGQSLVLCLRLVFECHGWLVQPCFRLVTSPSNAFPVTLY